MAEAKSSELEAKVKLKAKTARLLWSRLKTEEVWRQSLELCKLSPNSDTEVRIDAKVLRMKAEEAKALCQKLSKEAEISRQRSERGLLR